MAESERRGAITSILGRLRDGERSAADDLLPLVEDELRSLARGIFAGERVGHTLQPTALLNEAWIRLGPALSRLEDRQHFFAVAARAMRQVLIDHARRQRTLKRGGDGSRVEVDLDGLATEAGGSSERGERRGTGGTIGFELLAFADVLERLAELQPRHAQVVELRLLGGLTIEETARMLEVSAGTVKSDWTMARAWMRSRLAE